MEIEEPSDENESCSNYNKDDNTSADISMDEENEEVMSNSSDTDDDVSNDSEDQTENIQPLSLSNKSKQNSNTIANTKKIGPQKQKKSIHTLLKKAKIYEIRKLTRRIETLQKLKGTEEQKAKNKRKSDRVTEEIKAIRSFIISDLAERTVDIFKGTADKLYIEMWDSCQDRRSVEKMLQKFSDMDDSDDKFTNLAYLRMLSSKDILVKLKLIGGGVNINPQKDKKLSRKEYKKQLQNRQIKKEKKAGTYKDNEEAVTNIAPPDSKKKKIEQTEKGDKITVPHTSKKKKMEHPQNVTENASKPPIFASSISEKKQLSSTKKEISVSEPSSQSITEQPNPTKKEKKVKGKTKDNFFLDHNPIMSDSDNNTDDEFSAPVKTINGVESTTTKSKNRMGQRQRKKKLEEKLGERNGKHMKSKFGNDRRNKFQSDKNSKFRKNKSESTKPGKVDKTLHPSWQAKQKQKAQQSIHSFAGTKITFD